MITVPNTLRQFPSRLNFPSRSLGNMNTLILGIGNILLRDEGVGVHVVNALEKAGLPDGVEALDGGTSGANLVDWIADRDKVIVVDATAADGQPGTVYRFCVDDLIKKTASLGSLHEFGFLETYLMARHLGCAPREVVIFGVQPADVQFGLDLSPSLRAQLPRVVDLVLEEARR
jgi:hydrogenase maturation protease